MISLPTSYISLDKLFSLQLWKASEIASSALGITSMISISSLAGDDPLSVGLNKMIFHACVNRDHVLGSHGIPTGPIYSVWESAQTLPPAPRYFNQCLGQSYRWYFSIRSNHIVAKPKRCAQFSILYWFIFPGAFNFSLTKANKQTSY